MAPTPTISWDPASLRLLAPGGVYGRLVRLADGTLLLGYERHGSCWVQRSGVSGGRWSIAVEAARFGHGAAANPEFCVLDETTVLLAYNERPHDGRHPFTIRTVVSRNGGRSWQPQALVYTADTRFENGCWEPSMVRLPDDRIHLYFANESPYRNSAEQEISLAVSEDQGATWSPPRTIGFRPGGRDGMPVPLLLPERRELVVAIEDRAPGRKLQPAILRTALAAPWPEPVGADGSHRWTAIDPPLAPDVYAGAPYLARLPDGRTLLACQSDAGRAESQMVVYLGDPEARNFHSSSVPFDVPSDSSARWNSLYVAEDGLITALSTTVIDGQGGIWAVDGRA